MPGGERRALVQARRRMSAEKNPTPPAELLAHARAIPLLARCGYELEACADGRATGALDVSVELAGPSGHLNGTELYGLLDCTAWFAVATVLGPDEAAVTHDAHFSMLGVAPTGTRVSLEAHVVKRGRSLAFLRVEAFADGRLFATATVTKSILPHGVRMRHAKPS